MRVFDLHCDTLTRCKKNGWNLENGKNTLHLSDAEDFDSYIQLYAVFIPDDLRGEMAQRYFSVHHAYYRRQLEEMGDALYDVNGLRTLAHAAKRRGMSSILAVEGGSVLGGDLDQVNFLANAGVRSLTLTWNSNNELAGGNLDDGRLTDFGRDVIRALEKKSIAVDVSHLNDQSFYDVMAFTDKPVIATHSNARAICGHPRNLTDEMFALIAERGGLVGLNFCRDFIAEPQEKADLHQMARHLEHFLDLGGENVLALGSDYDGAKVDPCIDRPQKLKDLYQVLLDDGVGTEIADKIFFDNAWNFFDKLLRREL